jgi:predicted flap endonuclease-1-like 5' DNA nuclease
MMPTLASSTGLSLETLHSVVRQAELSRIRGIGPKLLSHLLAVGVDSAAALAAIEPEALRMRLLRVTARPPNLAVLENLIRQAQS